MTSKRSCARRFPMPSRSRELDVDGLVVSRPIVNEGPRQKRIRPAPMGRAYRYQRRTSQITVVVEAPEE